MPRNRNSAMVPPRLRLNRGSFESHWWSLKKSLNGYSRLLSRWLSGTSMTRNDHRMTINDHLMTIFLALSLAACQPSAPKLNPKAPDAAYSRTAMDVRNEKFLSTVNIPVAISLADVERQINAQVNGLIYEDKEPNADLFMARVWKRGAIRVRAGLADADTDAAKDSVFAFDVPLKIWTKAGVKVLGFTQFRETEFAIDLHFTTRFSIDADWSVSTHTQATGYDWVTKPVFRIAGFEIPIAGFVGKMIDKNLGAISQSLDQQVRKNIDLRTPVLQAWNSIRRPYLLSEQYRTYLLVVPKRIVSTPLQFSADMIRTTIGIEGYTLTTVGPKPDVRPAVTLPDLVTVGQVPTAFRVGVMAEASYAEVARMASQEMVGKTFGFSDNRYSVTITDMDVYGQNDNLIIKAGLKGSVDGHIFLRGRPYYDANTKTISLRNLTYDIDTRSLLQRTASWLLQGTLTRTMEKNLTFPVGAQLNELHRTLQDQLTNNRLAKGVVLNGRLDALQPDQVYLTSTSLLAVVYASGQVGVRVEGLQ
ncbi:MAG: DUF4403 family protein [Bacteroidetes bacterium]|nr:DUF4403 family protein [Fibrella sp.]